VKWTTNYRQAGDDNFEGIAVVFRFFHDQNASQIPNPKFWSDHGESSNRRDVSTGGFSSAPDGVRDEIGQ
jgi:hypothetical protein